MKATWNNVAVAEADKADLIYIEGNWYFPPASLKRECFTTNDTHTTCVWKGEASYYNVVVDGQVNDGAAWYYPHPTPSAFERTAKDFTDYVAFWRGVTVSE